ncbi:XXYS1_4_G0051380.mRNA.1.CDS.1 [Saccharomyces cerevisiae]|nr:XXYS1_4_G0051380.mRNA.1.CDS.1 [Saccharomyces cerevisiae]CAI4240235.1 AMH_1a_G0000670.mRNA.1.CDS.1 [Saccharomyces cerevisiae]CAI4242791.1 CEI_1a_G0000570.mRNA.1.CDS.1 [Saccharomyces cerevisiae]CAI6471558.1 AMH_1a_G0000670.mRNA.1.CDS.1 [Saccharomyces cerevisiae]CAI7126748.1 CEI_1a_G0000570.mRNA.1.CDS.1 [Saccharomyces cerevisiae]
MAEEGGTRIAINIYAKRTAKGEEVFMPPLVFDIDHIKLLRKWGICGVLSGTLPTAAQQNVFLSVPLRLMLEDVLWLHLNNLADVKLIRQEGDEIMEGITLERGAKLSKIVNDRLNKSFEYQKKFKKDEHIAKLKKIGRINDKTTAEELQRLDKSSNNDQLIESSLFIDIANTSMILRDIRSDSDSLSRDDISDLLFKQYRQAGKMQTYFLYKALRDQGYVLSPGGRFGGKFIAYPGDPLRFHSHLTIQDAIDYHNEPIDLISMISGARLGTTVKKLWVIGGVAEETKETHFFSIEWAGFG